MKQLILYLILATFSLGCTALNTRKNTTPDSQKMKELYYQCDFWIARDLKKEKK